jgi:Na+-driven multidrug efflux pump
MAAAVIKLLRLLTKSLLHDSAPAPAHKNLTKAMKWAAGVALVVAILLAFYPQPIINLAQSMIELI